MVNPVAYGLTLQNDPRKQKDRLAAVSAEIRTERYAFRKVSRSALTVSACVVGMPCGRSL